MKKKKKSLFKFGMNKRKRSTKKSKGLLMAKKRRVDMYYAMNKELPKEEAWKKRDDRVDIFLMLAEQKGKSLSNYSKMQLRIIKELFYLLSHSGATCCSAKYLSERCGCSIQTVYRTVAKVKHTNQLSVGFVGTERKGTYVFVDKLHENYVVAMQFIFHFSEEQALAECEEFVVMEMDIFERVFGLDKSSTVYKRIKELHKVGVLNQYLSLNDIRLYRNGFLDEGELYYLLEERVKNLNTNKVKYLNNDLATLLFNALYDVTNSILMKEGLYRIIKHFMELAKWNPSNKEFGVAKNCIVDMFNSMNESLVKNEKSLIKRFEIMYNNLMNKVNKEQPLVADGVQKVEIVEKREVPTFYDWINIRE